jgi:hypothetical protein
MQVVPAALQYGVAPAQATQAVPQCWSSMQATQDPLLHQVPWEQCPSTVHCTQAVPALLQ